MDLLISQLESVALQPEEQQLLPADTPIELPGDANSYQDIDLTTEADEITKRRFRLLPMYGLDKQGKEHIWQIAFDGQRLVIVHGQSKGKLQTDFQEIELNKSGRNLTEQALLEMRNRAVIKKRDGYCMLGATEPADVKVMTAVKYTKTALRYWPVYCQDKEDGVRMRCYLDAAGKVVMVTRKNVPFRPFKHLEPLIYELFLYLPAHSSIEGELIVPGMSRNEIQSVVMTELTDDPNLHKVEYRLFELYWEENPPYEQRYERLERALATVAEYYGSGLYSYINLIEAKIAHDNDDIEVLFQDAIAREKEGIMIRQLGGDSKLGSERYRLSQYVHGRTVHMLKYKKVDDEEGTIIDVYEGTGRERGCALLKVADPRGNYFGLRMEGSLDRRRHWFQNPQLVLGKRVTYEYRGLGPNGTPQHAVGICIREVD